MMRESKTAADMRIFRRGFTMIELLVVIGIVVLLLAILMPVVAQVRTKAFVAQTEAQMQRIMGGIQAYYHDHNAYPGPLSEAGLAGGPPGTASQMPANLSGTPTSSENLVMGLLGVLQLYNLGQSGGQVEFIPLNQSPPGDVSSLNPNRPKMFHYIDYVPEELSQSGYAYGAAGASRGTDSTATSPGMPNTPKPEMINDSNVPEFLDHIPDAMPILYMRAQVGGPTPASGGKFIGMANTDPAQYFFTELAPYGFTNVSGADFAPQPAQSNGQGGMAQNPAQTPFDVYFQNPAISTQPRGKDSFILISAGADRMYGTKDDIIVTP